MRFTSDTLNGIADGLRASADGVTRASGENLHWECRIADVRRDGYERAMRPADADSFNQMHTRFVQNHVNLKSGPDEPACFHANNQPALVPVLDEGERLVRIEDLTGWVELIHGRPPNAGPSPTAIKAAFDARSADPAKAAEIRELVTTFNAMADARPRFAAVAGDLDCMGNWRESWWTVLPEWLGLGHLAAAAEHPRAVALIEYRADRVIGHQANGIAPDLRFAAPTVIDHTLNPYFCPSPTPVKGAPISYGRAVNLAARGTLVCELIHRHFPYEVDDIKDVVVLTGAVPCATVGDMRRAHLGALRKQPGWAGFGT